MTPVVVVAVLVLLTGGAASRLATADQRARARARLHPVVPVDPPPWFTATLVGLGLDGDPARSWPAVRTLGGVALVVLAVAEPGPALAVLAAVTIGPRVGAAVSSRTGGRRRSEADLPRLVDTWVASLGSGASLAQAVERTGGSAGPGAQGVEEVSARHRRGEPLQVALDRWAAARPSSGAPLVADALALAGASGASQVRALERVAATLREREALRREVTALGAQAHLSASVLILVPVAFALVVGVLDGRVRHVMVATPLGWACLSAGAALDLAGAAWMRRLVGGER